MTLSTEHLRERQGQRKRERERERVYIYEAKEGGRYGGERLSETSTRGVNSNFSSAMALALLHAYDARSSVYFRGGYPTAWLSYRRVRRPV